MAEQWVIISKSSVTLSKNKRIMRVKKEEHNGSLQICRGSHKVEDNNMFPIVSLVKTRNN